MYYSIQFVQESEYCFQELSVRSECTYCTWVVSVYISGQCTYIHEWLVCTWVVSVYISGRCEHVLSVLTWVVSEKEWSVCILECSVRTGVQCQCVNEWSVCTQWVVRVYMRLHVHCTRKGQWVHILPRDLMKSTASPSCIPLTTKCTEKSAILRVWVGWKNPDAKNLQPLSLWNPVVFLPIRFVCVCVTFMKKQGKFHHFT